MALVDAHMCHLWDLKQKAYVGAVPPERCKTAEWLEAPGHPLQYDIAKDMGVEVDRDDDDSAQKKKLSEERTRHSLDGKRLVRWHGSSLVIERAGSSVPASPVAVEAGCIKKS